MTGAEDREIILAEIPKNTREVWRVTLGAYDGHEMIYVSAWGKRGGDWYKKANGLAVRRDKYREIFDLLATAETRLLESELAAA